MNDWMDNWMIEKQKEQKDKLSNPCNGKLSWARKKPSFPSFCARKLKEKEEEKREKKKRKQKKWWKLGWCLRGTK